MPRRRLSPDELEIWSQVARSARPLRPDLPAALTPPSAETAAPRSVAKPRAPVTPAAAPAEPFRIGAAARSGRGTTALPADPAGPAPVRMDTALHRQMSAGKLRPEARIDLHGHTLAEAQPELHRFVSATHARGCRLVLVITGKGRGGAGAMGALRHQVPHWLGLPPLRDMVLQVTPAHRRHGGDGALYVYLRKRR